MPELTDEEFFAILNAAPKPEMIEASEEVAPEAPDLPALVNADGTVYPARRRVQRPVVPAVPSPSKPRE